MRTERWGIEQIRPLEFIYVELRVDVGIRDGLSEDYAGKNGEDGPFKIDGLLSSHQ